MGNNSMKLRLNVGLCIKGYLLLTMAQYAFLLYEKFQLAIFLSAFTFICLMLRCRADIFSLSFLISDIYGNKKTIVLSLSVIFLFTIMSLLNNTLMMLKIFFPLTFALHSLYLLFYRVTDYIFGDSGR
jgi:hypothetical protein